MAPGYCNQMFNGKATAMPCAELKQRFPNLYMEPMQMNNSENKSYDTIPYMLINLGDVDTIYIGEDASCEYVEVNEIIEDVQGINWQPPHARKMPCSKNYKYGYCPCYMYIRYSMLVQYQIVHIFMSPH